MRFVLLVLMISSMGILLCADMTQETIHIQVQLTDDTPEQSPFEGTATIVLRIFDAQVGGNLLWSTNLPEAVFLDGLFEIELGNDGNPIPQSVLSNETIRYLEIEINGEIQNPRQIIIATENSKDTQSEHTGAYLQSDAIAFFNLTQCPAGWSEFTQAQGRYIVGLPANGTSGAMIGTALSDLENRPVGKHTHTINDPSHSHSCLYESGCNLGSGSDWYCYSNTQQAVSSATTGITIHYEGLIQGTNAPYIQYILCVLN